MKRLLQLGFALGVMGWVGCGGDGSSIYNPGQGATGGSGGAEGGSGGEGGAPGTNKPVGADCGGDEECRSGLTCDDGTCQPGHSQPEGADCVISAECADGLYCEGGACTPAGNGARGDTCLSDADCQSGFRCALEGFSATCVPEGGVDLGGECTLSIDCFGGLACIDGLCAQLPGGTPPFGPPFGGVECEDPSTTGVEAYFRVPRSGDDGDFFRLPFPNDVRKSGTSLDLDGFPTPGAGLGGVDPLAPYVEAIEDENDGWGMYQGVFFRFSGRLDADSLEQTGTVHLVDLTSGSPLSLYWTYSAGRTNYVCHNRLLVRRSLGRVFEPNHTYAAYVTTLVKDENGDDVARAADLVALLGDTAPADAALAPHWGKYASFRQYLATNTIASDSVLDATVFTVGNPRHLVEQLQTVIDAAAPPTAADWTLCDTGVTSPCPDATGPRACGAADPDFYELHALVELPIFQRGTAPYLTDGGDLDSSGGAPVPVRSEEVCMALSVPKSAMPSSGWPTVVFAHGTGGHFRSHIDSGIAKSFALGQNDGLGNFVRAAVLGIDQVQHGPRRNGSSEDPSDLYFNFQNPHAAAGNPQQAAADQMALLRFVPTVDFPSASPTGVPFHLTGNVAFWGHSQGASAGGLAGPYGGWAGVVFSGQGGSVKDVLVEKHNPVDIAGVLPFVVGDVDSMGRLPQGRHHPAVELLQLYLDGADPLAYARLLALQPPAGLAARHVLQSYGVGDTYTPSPVQASYGIGAALELAQHHPSVVTVEAIGALDQDDELPVPASGNLFIGGKLVSALLREYAPAAGSDGHFVVFEVAAARGDTLRFLAGSLGGIAPRVGP
jgi:hypothetical protein